MLRTQRLRRWAHIQLAVWYFLLFLCVFTVWRGLGEDEVFYYAHVSSPLFDGDFDQVNDIAQSNNEAVTVFRMLTIVHPTGQPFDTFAIGTGLLWAPFLTLMRCAGYIADMVGWTGNDWPWSQDRYSFPYMVAISIATWIYGYLSVALSFESCRILFRRRPSLWAAAAAPGATTLLGYAFQGTAMSHAHSAFTTALLILVSLRCRKFLTWREYCLVAVALALCGLVRWQDFIFGLLPASLWMQRLLRGHVSFLKELPKLIAAGATLFALFAPQLAFWYAQTGSALTIPQGSGYMYWNSPQILNLLFAGWHGLMYCHPFVAVAFAGLPFLALVRRTRTLGLALCGIMLIQIYVNACAADWMGNASFGARRFTSVVPIFVLGWAVVFNASRMRLWQYSWALCTVAATVANICFLAAASRGITDPYYWTELWLLRDVWAQHLEFLWTIPQSSIVLANFFAEGGDPLYASTLLLAAAAMLALALVMLLARWRLRYCSYLAYGLCTLTILVTVWILTTLPPTRTYSVEFANEFGVRSERARQSPLRSSVLERYLSLPEATAAHLYAARIENEPQIVQASLAQLYNSSPRLWSRIIATMPIEQVGAGAKIAAACVPVYYYNLLDICWRKQTVSSRVTAARKAAGARTFLKYFPLKPEVMVGYAYHLRRAGRAEAADAVDAELARICDVRRTIVAMARKLERVPVDWLVSGQPYYRCYILLLERAENWHAAATIGKELLDATSPSSHDEYIWALQHFVLNSALADPMMTPQEALALFLSYVGDPSNDDFVLLWDIFDKKDRIR